MEVTTVREERIPGNSEGLLVDPLLQSCASSAVQTLGGRGDLVKFGESSFLPPYISRAARQQQLCVSYFV